MALGAAMAGTVTADDLVMVMAADGSLGSEGQDGAAFAKHYGRLASEDARGLLLFSNEAEPAIEGAADRAAAPSGRIPSPEVLAGIDATALRYAGHDALRQAGLGASDWLLLYQANIEVESGYDPRAMSPVGAIGLGQLMPGTAALLQVDPQDWQQNLDGSARYLLAQLGRFGSAELALAAYNAGPEAVAEHNGIPPYPETQGHVRRVLAVVARLRGDP